MVIDFSSFLSGTIFLIFFFQPPFPRAQNPPFQPLFQVKDGSMGDGLKMNTQMNQSCHGCRSPPLTVDCCGLKGGLVLPSDDVIYLSRGLIFVKFGAALEGLLPFFSFCLGAVLASVPELFRKLILLILGLIPASVSALYT
ncbi:hypothetical protein Ccrd_024399 [Cynara cardunculus var. scolymus]|uniref:Uncharacterized protein n=1 Tax=Cynara cardunculus var. scolymus TaxID=59895 RepID=A0A118JSG1_CYNCS|nr:hypothetical protein Ccrd_024399 [Cynara cardunculus var. scolymus]